MSAGVKLLTRRAGLGRVLLTGSVVLATLAVLAYGLARNWQEIVQYDWHIAVWPLILALVIYPFALLLAVAIWRSILRQLGGRASWAQDLRIFCVSNLARRLPTVVPFVAGRLVLYEELGVAKSITSLATLIEGALILFSGLSVSLLILPLTGGGGWLASHVVELALIAALCLAVVLRPQILAWSLHWLMRRIGRGQAVTGQVDHRHTLAWTASYAVVWAIGGTVFYCLVRSVYPLAWGYLPLVVGIWSIGGVVSHIAVFTAGGLGIRELAMSVLLARLMPMPIAIIVSIVARAWFSLNELLWLALAMRWPRRR